MKLEKANEIFRTKYPNGRIFAPNTMGAPKGRISVIFGANSKVYGYVASSYQELLRRFGFPVLYKHNVENYKKELSKLNKEVEAGGYKDTFGFAGIFGNKVEYTKDGLVKFSDMEIDEKKKEIARIEKILANSIIV